MPSSRVWALGALALALSARLLALDPDRPVSQYALQSIEESIPGGRARTLLQGRDGYLWIGTYDGLARYDGVRVSIYDRTTAPGIRSNVVTCILETSDGTIWFGTQSGLSSLRGGEVATVGTKQGLPNERVAALVPDGAGGLWIGTDAGLARLQKGRISAAPDPFLASVRVHALLLGRDGTLWVGSSKGLHALSGTERRAFTTKDGLIEDAVATLFEDADGRILAGHRSAPGLSIVSQGRVSTMTRAEGLPDAPIRSIVLDGDGALWLATWGNGVCRLARGRTETLGAANGLADDFAVATCLDREGSLWIATFSSLARVYDGRFSVLARRHGLLSDPVRTIAGTRAGAVWIGGLPGLNRVVDGKIVNVDTGPGEVRTILEDRAGRVWVGTGSALLQIADPLGPAPRPVKVLDLNEPSDLAEDAAGHLWVALNGGGVLELHDGKKLRAFGKAEGLGTDRVSALLFRADGALAVGTHLAGVHLIYPDGRVEPVLVNEKLSRFSVMALLAEPDGALLVGTNGAGIFRVDERGFSVVGTPEGLLDDTVFSLDDDGAGNVVMTSSRGIWRVSHQELTAVLTGRRPRLSSETFDLADGLPTMHFQGGSRPTTWKAPDGALWFATARGAVRMNPSWKPRATSAPRPLVEQVTLDSTPTPHVPRVVVPSSQRRIRLEYAAPTFGPAARLRFRVRLEGFDEDWVDAGSSRVAYYSSLRPGTFSFHVQVRDGGKWIAAQTPVLVEVQPTLTETLAFRIAALLSVVLVTAAAVTARHRAHVRSMKERQDRLQEEVRQRTRELSTANEELTKLGRVKDEFLGIAAHDLKNPLNAVKGYVGLLREESDLDPAERDEVLRNIGTAASRMFELVKNLLDVNALERGQVSTTLVDLDVVPLARAAVQSYLTSATDKDQRLTLSAPGVPVLARADGSLLAQVLDNLVSNAVKYSPRGKPILVRVTPRDDGPVIAVIDQGPGLSADDQAKLFGAFARLSARPTGGEHSTGLGLSIVKKLVEAMGGRITCTSTLGNGATFAVSLPQAVQGVSRAGEA